MNAQGGRMARGKSSWPILTILPCGGLQLPEECKCLFFPRIPVGHAQLIDNSILPMVVINQQNVA
jgi:hypothetical protein